MTSSAPPPFRSATADWARALQRTAAIAPSSTLTLPRVVEQNAALFGDRPALIGESVSLTYRALARRANQVARFALAQGLTPGDRVALVMGNHPDYVAIWLGLSRVGIVTALINTQLVGGGLAHALAVADARLVIVDAPRRDAVRAAAGDAVPLWVHDGMAPLCLADALDGMDADPPADDAVAPVRLRDPALLIYTSGTTGLPKAANVSHYRVMMWSEWFAGIMDATPDDRLFNCLPMYHSIGGVVAIGAPLVAGASVIVRKGFSASTFWEDVVGSEATIFQYIGELCRYLLKDAGAPPPRHGLRLCCGNGLRADVWEAFAARFAIPRIIEFYAATEGSFSLFNLEGKPGAIGRIPRFMAHRSPVALVKFDVASEAPVRGVDGFCLRCDTNEPGEAIGRVGDGEGLATRFEGYTDRRDSERKLLRDVFEPGDVWFRTGDLMKRDDMGFFSFVDRIGDTFRGKGENVTTAEVSDALCAAPGVEAASVYGVAVPHAEGRACMAALVVRDDFDLEVLRRHAAAHLPRYARPLFLRLRTAQPLTGTFKVRKADDVREGFDPALVADPLYVDDGTRYAPLDTAWHQTIVSGALRL
jgi:fatty-acyl-CoA synthase